MYPTFHRYLQHWAHTSPDHRALICQERSVSYAQLLMDCQRLAEWLLAQGLQRGDRILYALHARVPFFCLLGAASMTGAVLVGVGTNYTVPEIAAIAGNVGPRFAFCDADVVDKVRLGSGLEGGSVVCCDRAVAGMRFWDDCLDDGRKGQRLSPALQDRMDEARGDDPLFIIHTSGTTGRPKGAVISQGNALASARAQSVGFGAPDGCDPSDVWQHQVPCNHVSGCIEWGIAPLVAGCSMILNDAFDPLRILENTQRYRATFLCGVPAMWNLMFRLMDARSFDLSSVRWTMVGAAPGSQEMFERLLRIAPHSSNPLGMTETSGFCTYSLPGEDAVGLAGNVGHAIDCLDCRIVGADGAPLVTGQVGRICYRGASVTSGYFNDPVATAAAFDADGFFVTDDLAYLDERGCLHLMGRNDDMFLSRGFCVYPVEIEMALLAHPDVALVAVLPIPHKVMGSVPRAYVLPKAGRCPDARGLRSFLSERLADYKIPRSFVVDQNLPLTSLGKPRKAELAARIAVEFGLQGGGR
ncbi:MAG: acyl--CoA ligase [Coriobacteriales bacterium]|nr:acyl--CoA ligase [Coriobacteriales bacterium]